MNDLNPIKEYIILPSDYPEVGSEIIYPVPSEMTLRTEQPTTIHEFYLVYRAFRRNFETGEVVYKFVGARSRSIELKKGHQNDNMPTL
jgi:hypothetical protein